MNNPKIAVVAIHGVGDHQPFEMARAAGNLLSSLKDTAHPRYCPFKEEWLRLTVSPVETVGRAFPKPGAASSVRQKSKRNWGPLDTLRHYSGPIDAAAAPTPASLDHLFMEGQLSEYKGEGPDETYEFLRLTGKRNAAPGAPEKDVHIYDMFWSDLSGVGKAGLRIFGEIYQLLFHLGSIGVNNVNAAAIALRDTPGGHAWSRFADWQRLAAAFLALPIPLLNLILLALMAPLFAVAALSRLSAQSEVIAIALLLFASLLALLGYKLFGAFGTSKSKFAIPVVAFLTASVVLGAAVAISGDSAERWREPSEAVAALVLTALAVLAVSYIVKAYERRRPGAQRMFRIMLGVVAIAAASASITLRPRFYWSMSFLLRWSEATFWLLGVAWTLFWITFVIAFVMGSLAVRASRADNPQDNRPERTNWTARLSLALSAMLLLTISFTVWLAIIAAARPLLPHNAPRPIAAPCLSAYLTNCVAAENAEPNFCYVPLLGKKDPTCTIAYSWIWETAAITGENYALVLLLLTAFALVIAIWAFAPSALDETSPPKSTGDAAHREAVNLGNWLDNGFKLLRWSGRLIYLTVLLLPVSGVSLFWSLFLQNARNTSASVFDSAVGMVLGAGSFGLLALGGRFSKLTLGLRPIVRVALDVDNWLREHPRNSNPTARICGRYISLLRYIAQYRGEDGKPYDAIVIFAHSQGTVITADLLRFLTVERIGKQFGKYDPSLAGLDRMNLYLLTMGCPLRQLYGLRFPYLYGFAPGAVLPEASDLGLTEWINAYRTGDYIGRYLWRNDPPFVPVADVSFTTWDPAAHVPANLWPDPTHTRVEFSIGPGAHTHYWDLTAEPIAETLDVLIARA